MSDLINENSGLFRSPCLKAISAEWLDSRTMKEEQIYVSPYSAIHASWQNSDLQTELNNILVVCLSQTVL